MYVLQSKQHYKIMRITRPQTANPKQKKGKLETKKMPIFDIIQMQRNLNDSNNKIYQNSKLQNIDKSQELLVYNQKGIETKSQNNKGQSQMGKVSRRTLVSLLFQLQLEKMGFSFKLCQPFIAIFLTQFDQQQQMHQIKSVKQWVLNKKSSLVQKVISAQTQKQANKNSIVSIDNIHNESKIKMVNMNKQLLMSSNSKKIYKQKQQTIQNFHIQSSQQQIKMGKATNIQDKITKIQIVSSASKRLDTPIPGLNSNKVMNQNFQWQSQQDNSANHNQIPIVQVPVLNDSPVQGNGFNRKIESRVCPICLNQSIFYLQRQCGHVFCEECINRYLLQNIAGGNYIVDCPEFQCHLSISEKEAARVLQPTALNKFLKFRQKMILQNNPENKFCTVPDCGKLLRLNQRNKLQCSQCNAVYCSLCQEPDHADKQCGQAIYMQINQVYKDLNIKKCPSCNSPIQKFDGCNHMTCKKCKYEFCWICLQHFTPYHYRIYNCCGCPGLQFDEPENTSFRRFLQIIFFIFLPITFSLAIFTIFAVLPFFMLFDLLTKPCRWIQQQDDKCELELLKCICQCLPQCIVAFIAYFVLLPRSVIYCIFISPFQYFNIIINIICNVV